MTNYLQSGHMNIGFSTPEENTSHFFLPHHAKFLKTPPQQKQEMFFMQVFEPPLEYPSIKFTF